MKDERQFTKDQLISALQETKCSGDTPVYIGYPELALHHVVESSRRTDGTKCVVLILREE